MRPPRLVPTEWRRSTSGCTANTERNPAAMPEEVAAVRPGSESSMAEVDSEDAPSCASAIVAAGAQPDSVHAQRIDIMLLSTDGDPTKLILELAADIDAANAAGEAQPLARLRFLMRGRCR